MKRYIPIILVLALAGCAAPEERVLTKEQDAEFAERCGEGCAIVPAPVFREILRRLQAAQGRST